MNYKEEYNALIKNLKNKINVDITLVEKAFKYAEKLHEGQFRKSGEPYIAHPVAVASILEKLNFDENVIAAGLLHDVVEDCACTVDEISKMFNLKITNLVDSVTAIEKSEKDKPEEFEKYLLEEKTYNKLYSFAKSDKLAFFIKFADRLHNLRTIAVFKRYKQIDKVKETEKWLLPILKNIKANTLYYNIKNECYKIVENKNYEVFNNVYEDFYKRNKVHLRKIFNGFDANINNVLPETISNARVVIKRMKPYEIINGQLTGLAVKPIKVKEFMFNKFITHKIFIIKKTSNKSLDKNKVLFQLFSSSSWFNNFKIQGFFKNKEMEEMPVIIRDWQGNKFAIYIQSEKEHFQYNNGLVEGVEIPYDESLEQFEISESYIKVKTNKNDIITLPENSSVLDFAFKVHNDFGFSCLGAFLNKSPNKVPIHTKLNNGDQINLVIERNEETNKCSNIAKIRWLSYVKTEYAKKKLSKYFENKYEM